MKSAGRSWSGAASSASPVCAEAEGRRSVNKESYVHDLGSKYRIEVAWTSRQGVLEEFLVGLYLRRPKSMVARFDNLHRGGLFDGIVHLDLVDRSGNLRAKVPFANVPLRNAINHAKNYFEIHAEALEAQFRFWG